MTCKEPYTWADPTEAEWEFAAQAKATNGGPRLKVVAYDYGIKLNILRRLAAFGCDVTVVPADFPAEKVGAGGLRVRWSVCRVGQGCDRAASAAAQLRWANKRCASSGCPLPTR